MRIGELYIKKSKLRIIDGSGQEIPDKSLVRSYMLVLQQKAAYKPKYMVGGIFLDEPDPKFILTDSDQAKHHLYLSVLVNPELSLDNYKLEKTIWSSYFQDRHGYYWQILNTDKLSEYQINHPKLITQSY